MKNKTLLMKTVITAAIKAGAAFIAFFMTLAITRTLSTEQSGLFLLAIAGLSVLNVIFRFGLDNVVLRKISAEDSHVGLQAMTTGLIWITIACFPFVLLCSIFSEFIADQLLSKPAFAPILAISIWALPSMALFMLFAAGFQAFHRVIATTFFQNLGVSLLFLLSFFLFWYFSPEKLSAVLAAQIYVASTVMVFVIAIFMWHRQIDGDWRRVVFKDTELLNASFNLWTATSMSMAVQWSGILMAGAFVISSDIAYLSAAQRTANLASFALVVVNMVVAPRYARLWHEGNVDEMRRLAKWSTRGMLLLVLPIIVVILFIPELIMGLFGDGYEKGAILLSIMAIGQFVNVATGSVGYLLNMSGHERDFRRVTMFAGPLTIILSYFFIIQWGVLGAAIATAVGLSLQNIGALFMVRKRLGFWPIG